MKNLFCVFAVFAIVVGSVAAQDAPTVHQTSKPGDPVHYVVQFEGKPDLDGVTLYFSLQEPLKKDQAGFAGQFTLAQLRPVSPGVFEVNGVIPKNAATGMYQLSQVNAVHDPGSRVYQAGEFPKVTIKVSNDAGYDFPALKSVTPTR